MVTTRKSYLDDLDYDEPVEPEIRDGESVRVPLLLTDSATRDHQPHFVRVTDAVVRDARTAAREARDQMIERATSAWRLPQRDAAEPPAAVMRRRTEPDEPSAADHQARRDAIWNDYKTRLGNAWKTDPNAATQIERRGERWRGGR